MKLWALIIAAIAMLTGAIPIYADNSYTVPVGATVKIDEHGECRQVTNPAGQPGGRFVSTRTAPEWQSFRDNPNGLVMAACVVNCTAPWGGTVAHGASITAYQAASVPHGSSCASQTRTCTNGSLSGTYTHQTCNVQPPAGGTWVVRGGYVYPPLSPVGCHPGAGKGICSCSGMPEPSDWPVDAYVMGQPCSQIGTCAGPYFDDMAMDIWFECQ
ncbi:MAG: hypothetical protein WC989_03805 [Micavibrio sp.]